MSETSLHEALKPLSWLAGRWKTQSVDPGNGKYPTIKDFEYHDVLEFICIGQPMYNFTSTSSHPEKKTPMHQEKGFLCVKPGTNSAAFVVSHNFGLTSVEEGTYDSEAKEIHLETTSISRISFAKSPQVTAFKRVLKLVSNDTLEIVLSMETENTPMTEHLRAVYVRES